MRAHAAILRQFNEPLSIEEVAIPELAPGQMLIQVEAAGVCGSDVHMWRGLDPRTPLPMILGHEGVGRIVDMASERNDIYGQPLKIGQRIIWERGVTCGMCHACAVLHEPALCPNRWVYGIYHGLDVPPHLNGCYCSHIILDPHTDMIPLDDDEDPALYVAASCSGATSAHGFDLSPAMIGDTVVIFGPGPVGAFCAALARAQGAEHILVIGGTTQRLSLCAELGATMTINRHESGTQERRQIILDLTQGRGADLVVEASGSRAAAAEGLELLRHGGTLSLVGFGTPVGNIELAPFESLVRKNARIQGVWVSDLRHTLQAISLVRQHRSAFARLVTHRFTLEQATEALETVHQRQGMKIVLQPKPLG